MSTQTRVIAITRRDTPVELHPRRDAWLRGADTVYLVGPYRVLLETLRNGQPLPEPSVKDGRPADRAGTCAWSGLLSRAGLKPGRHGGGATKLIDIRAGRDEL